VRRALLSIAVVAMVAANWAAIYDILRGEPDLAAEWTFVTFSVLLLGSYLLGRVLGARTDSR
jgi:hypothetical protein